MFSVFLYLSLKDYLANEKKTQPTSAFCFSSKFDTLMLLLSFLSSCLLVVTKATVWNWLLYLILVTWSTWQCREISSRCDWPALKALEGYWALCRLPVCANLNHECKWDLCYKTDPDKSRESCSTSAGRKPLSKGVVAAMSGSWSGCWLLL